MRQPVVNGKLKFKTVKVYDIMYVTNEKSQGKELTHETETHLSKH